MMKTRRSRNTEDNYFILPLLLPMVFSALLVMLFKPNVAQNTVFMKPPHYTETFTHWLPGSGALMLSSPKFIENAWPNVVNRTVVTKPYIIPEIRPFQYIGDIGSDAVIPSKSEIEKQTESAQCELIEMNNVFITNEGVMIHNNTFYPDDCECHWQQCNNYKARNFPSTIQYSTIDKAIAITHEYGWFYAHFIIDFFPRFYVVPKEILESSYIIVTDSNTFTVQGLEILGVKRDKIVNPTPGTAVFIKKLYTVGQVQCTKFNAFLLMNMRTKLAEKYGLDKAKPNRYILYNRENTQFRVINNFAEIVKSIKTKYPKFAWENVNIPNKLEEQFKLFNSFKVFFSLHGAAFSNTLFMQPGTAVVEIQVDRWVDNYLWLSAFNEVHHIISRDKTIMWREQGSKNTINTDTCLQLIKLALEATGDIPVT